MARSIKKKRGQYTRKDYEKLIQGNKKQKGGGNLEKNLAMLMQMTPKYNKNASQRIELAKNLNTSEHNILRKICCDFLKMKLDVSPSTINKLRKYEKAIRCLADKKTSLKKARKVSQDGGFIQALLP